MGEGKVGLSLKSFSLLVPYLGELSWVTWWSSSWLVTGVVTWDLSCSSVVPVSPWLSLTRIKNSGTSPPLSSRILLTSLHFRTMSRAWIDTKLDHVNGILGNVAPSHQLRLTSQAQTSIWTHGRKWHPLPRNEKKKWGFLAPSVEGRVRLDNLHTKRWRVEQNPLKPQQDQRFCERAEEKGSQIPHNPKPNRRKAQKGKKTKVSFSVRLPGGRER